MAWLRENRLGLALGALVLVAALAAGSRAVGLAWDDGVYVAAGQSLARGAGYVLANRVGDQAVPLYPPGYPLAVAFVWKFIGSQAAVLAALGALSALCIGAAAFLWWRVLRAETSPVTAALLVAIPSVSYATLVVGELRMADAPYALLVAAVAALWSRATESRRAMTAVVLLAALGAPLRSAGAVLPLAVALLLVARRRWGAAAATIGAAAVLAAVLALALRPPEPSYGAIVQAAWGPGGAGSAILRDNLTRDVWTSLAALVAPPLVYSAAVQRVAHAAPALLAAYGAAVAVVGTAVSFGGWRRLQTGRWAVGDLALVGAVGLVFLVPLGMLPRFLVPVGPVVALWAWEGTRRSASRGWSVATCVVLGVLLAFTAAEAVRHDRAQPRVLAVRSAAYAAAGRAARSWLGPRGLVAAEFPEALWFEAGLRSVPTYVPLSNVQSAGTSLDELRRRLAPVARGCLMDTRSFPASRELFDEYEGRKDVVELAGLDARYVRVVCWARRPAEVDVRLLGRDRADRHRPSQALEP